MTKQYVGPLKTDIEPDLINSENIAECAAKTDQERVHWPRQTTNGTGKAQLHKNFGDNRSGPRKRTGAEKSGDRPYQWQTA